MKQGRFDNEIWHERSRRQASKQQNNAELLRTTKQDKLYERDWKRTRERDKMKKGKRRQEEKKKKKKKNKQKHQKKKKKREKVNKTKKDGRKGKAKEGC